MPTKGEIKDALDWWESISLEKRVYLNQRYYSELETTVDKLLPYQIVEIWKEETYPSD